MTADSIKPQADVNSQTMSPSAQYSKVNRLEVDSKRSREHINLLLYAESLNSTELSTSTRCLLTVISFHRSLSIPFSNLLESWVFEALVRAVVLSGMHKPPVYIPEIGAAILRFPLDVLKSHYSKPNISPERRAWLSDIFEKAIGTLYELKENGPVTVLLDDVQDVIMPTE